MVASTPKVSFRQDGSTSTGNYGYHLLQVDGQTQTDTQTDSKIISKACFFFNKEETPTRRLIE
jgi:hypothetical protein